MFHSTSPYWMVLIEAIFSCNICIIYVTVNYLCGLYCKNIMDW